ncbi:sodium/proline symporter [Gemmatimonas aurantiaca]|nr:sodium/proline symporter [Gemmatimonas aurantiaca]
MTSAFPSILALTGADATQYGFVIYLMIIFAVGLITYKYNKTISDYVLGGRKLGIWVVTFSERASGESAWLLLGLPAALFASGLVEIWVAIGCCTGILCSWIFIAKPLRVQSEKYNAITLPEFFENRFNDTSHNIKYVATVIIVIFFIFYVAAQFLGAAKVLNATFGMDKLDGMMLGAAIILFYTAMGGFMAVAWTDFVQSMLMIGTLVILPIALYIEIGGYEQVSSFIAAGDASFGSLTGGKTGLAAWLSIISGLAWGLGYMAQPHLITRFMAVNNPEDLRKGALIGISWAVIAFWGAMFIGLFGAVYFAGQAIADPEQIMPLAATQLLPGWLAGVLISGAIAAMMSTADSQLLVATSAVAKDIYHGTINPNASDKKLVAVSRYTTIIVGAVAFGVAYYALVTGKDFVFKIVGFAWSGLGSAFGPALLLTLWWKGVTKEGVLAGMLTGSIVTVVWRNVPYLKSEIGGVGLFEIVPAFVLAFLAVWLVSVATYKEGPRRA